ncbi:MAG: hypothetical protein FJ126_01150 [Deltaproteobacteria bacterium]|nr:hypothetical protein [Deltaproteobacteria bacterium]
MKAKILPIAAAAVSVLLLMSAGVLAQGAFMWDGTQWPQLSFDAKVGFIKGIGNLADFEVAANKDKAPCVSRAFVDELKTKKIDHIIQEVDKYYQENPGKKDATVIEVVLRRCTSICPPEEPAGGKK